MISTGKSNVIKVYIVIPGIVLNVISPPKQRMKEKNAFFVVIGVAVVKIVL